MIKSFVFDLGGVILKPAKRNSTNYFSLIFGKDAQIVTEMFEKDRIALNSGQITTRDFLKKAKQLTGNNKNTQTLYRNWQALYTEDVEEINSVLLNIISKLRKSYDVYMMTDTIDLHDEYNKKRGIYEQFDRVFKSYTEGLLKSNTKAFVNLLKKIDRKPEEVVFIDDKSEYIDVAKNLGIYGILFENNKKLEKLLLNLGVKF